MHAGALRRSDVDTHPCSTEDESTLKLLLRDHRSDAKPDTVEHEFGVVRIGVGLHAYVRHRPTFLLKVFLNRLLERISRKISRHKDLLVCYFFHSIAFQIFVHFSRWIVTGPYRPESWFSRSNTLCFAS